MIPGPTNVDPAVLRALSKPTLSHGSSEFVKIFKETLDDLKKSLHDEHSGFCHIRIWNLGAQDGDCERARCRPNALCSALAKRPYRGTVR